MKRLHKGTNRNRWCWRTMRHHERLWAYYARAGRYYLADLAEQGVVFWRKQLEGS